jgi:hypothetical protein
MRWLDQRAITVLKERKVPLEILYQATTHALASHVTLLYSSPFPSVRSFPFRTVAIEVIRKTRCSTFLTMDQRLRVLIEIRTICANRCDIFAFKED